MGKFDNEVKSIYHTYDTIELSSDMELLEEKNHAFAKLLMIIKDYRSRLIDKRELLSYFEQIQSSDNINNTIENIRSKIMKDVVPEHQLLSLLYTAAKSILSMTVYLTGKSTNEILDELYSLYMVKNTSYGDTWYGRGSYGIYTELERKVYRLNRVISEEQLSCNDYETIEDTLKDTLNYITFFIICIKYIDPILITEG